MMRANSIAAAAARAVAVMACFTACPLGKAQPAADVALTGGKIVTVDAGFSIAEAIAIDDGRIVAVGTNDAVRRYVGAATQVIDVGGATVIPGLIDNHFHFARAVQRWHLQARLDGVDSRREALRILADKAAASPEGQWVMVQGGWSPQQFADAPGGFTLAELDGVAPRNPLFVQQGYSIVYANSLALRAVGLDPKDGAQRNAAGLATFQPPYGAFIERIPPTTPEQFERNLTDFMRTLSSVGLTGVYSLGRGPEGESERIEARALREDLPLRIWETLTFEATDPAAADAAVALIERSRPNTFRDDFGLFGLGEHVYLPFFDLPNQAGPWPKPVIDEYLKLAAAAARGGWHIHEHTMTNFSVTDLLDGFERLNATQPIGELRWTLAHVYDISPANIERARSARAHARRARRRDARGGEDAAAHDSRQRHRLGPRHRRDDRLALSAVRDARLGRQRARPRRPPRARRNRDARGGVDRAHALERVSVLPRRLARLARGRQAGGSRRARSRLPHGAGRRDQGHPSRR